MPRTTRRALVAFFITAFGGSWLVWGSELARQQGLIASAVPDAFAYLAVSVAAVTVTTVVGGRAGLRDFAARFAIWRLSPAWYAVAVLLPALPALAAVALYSLAGGQPQVGALVPLAATVPLLLTQTVTHLLTEEAGWRGFALPRLRSRFSPLGASLILGSLWAAWHLPLFFLIASRQSYPFAGFAVQVLSITIVMTWLFDRTRGSVLIAALFHAAMNTSLAVLNVLWSGAALFWLCTALTALLALVVVALQWHETRTDAAVPVTHPRASVFSGGER